MNKFFIIVGVTFFISCKTQQINENICGVWIFESEVNDLYLNDTSQFFVHQYPIIYDFKEDGDLVFKHYPKKDTTYSWLQKTDTILTINGLDYTIHSFNQDSITLIDYNRADTYWLIFKRTKETFIDYSKTEIEKILLSNIWSTDDTLNRKWATRFEYFPNNIMIYRYRIFDRNLNESADNLQLERWGVAKYKEYFFLYNYSDFYGNGNLSKVNQITDISPNSYTISGSNSKSNSISFHSKKIGTNNHDKLITLKGNWISHNSESKTYGKFIPEQEIENGQVALFEGDLHLTLKEDILSLKVGDIEPWEYNWQISKDGKTLVLEYPIDEAETKGIKFEYVDILELNDSKLKIRLFNNSLYTGLKSPNRYLLNLIQEFEKVE